ncbi:MAG: response regulator transcription factor [Actinobacteria bacterium]|nr:response regulator transcription factor [Actinomycetota bacterium]
MVMTAARAGGGDRQSEVTARVLWVDDHPELNEVVTKALSRAGFDVVSCQSMRTAREALDGARFDVALVDLILPDGDGLELVEDMTATCSVIVVSGRAGEGDRILGLETGADDYITKPFSMGELVARVRAAARRKARGAPRVGRLTVGDVEVDLGARVVRLAGRPVELTRMEFEVLAVLARNAGRACSRDELLHWVWGATTGTVDTATVTEHLRRIRLKIEDDPFDPKRILTVRGVGYRMEPGPERP